MSKVDVVLGAFYGDEGKGKIIDYLSSNNLSIVMWYGIIICALSLIFKFDTEKPWAFKLSISSYIIV